MHTMYIITNHQLTELFKVLKSEGLEAAEEHIIKLAEAQELVQTDSSITALDVIRMSRGATNAIAIKGD